MRSSDLGWKLEWSLRTGLSSAVVAALFLSNTSRSVFQFDGHAMIGPSFAGFVTVMVADATFGRTTINAWGCVLVSVPVSLLTAGVLAATWEFYSEALAIPLITVLVFTLQLMNLPLMGKRLGLSLLILNLVREPDSETWKFALGMLVDTLMGICIAYAGILAPWPRCAFAELQDRIDYSAESFQRIFRSLLYGMQSGTKDSSAKVAQWRHELLGFVQREILFCRIRLVDARWGPRRARALSTNASLVGALHKCALSAQQMCSMFDAMRFGRFPALDCLMTATAPALERWEAALFNAWSSCIAVQRNTENTENVQVELREAARAFDEVYFETRREVYYSSRGDALPIEPEALIFLNAFLLELHVVTGTLIELLSGGFKEPRCCDKSLLRDLFPSQRHFVSYCRLPLAQVPRQQLIVAFKLALAICIATCWGYFAFDSPNALPAFTITYIGGSINSGDSVALSLLRGAGTVVAAVFADVVSRFVEDFDATSQNIVAGIAIVAFVIPATYIRSHVEFSYAGTVAGFTATLLLLETPQGNVGSLSSGRIKDTFVGLCILILVELTLWPLHSESQLYTKVYNTLSSVHAELNTFHHNFEDMVRSSPGEKESCPASRKKRKNALSMEQIAEQKVLIRAMGYEPRAGHASLNSKCIDDIVEAEQELCVLAMQLSRTMDHINVDSGLLLAGDAVAEDRQEIQIYAQCALDGSLPGDAELSVLWTIPEKPNTSFKMPIASHKDHHANILQMLDIDYSQGEPLTLSAYRKVSERRDELLGSITIGAELVFPAGYDGDLYIKPSDGNMLTLKVKITTESLQKTSAAMLLQPLAAPLGQLRAESEFLWERMMGTINFIRRSDANISSFKDLCGASSMAKNASTLINIEEEFHSKVSDIVKTLQKDIPVGPQAKANLSLNASQRKPGKMPSNGHVMFFSSVVCAFDHLLQALRKMDTALLRAQASILITASQRPYRPCKCVRCLRQMDFDYEEMLQGTFQPSSPRSPQQSSCDDKPDLVNSTRVSI